MALVVYPLNNIDYKAEDVALYTSTRSSGIYAGDDFSFSMTGSDNTISVDVGIAWLRLSRFFGVVAALKSKAAVDMGLPDATFPRIDALVLQFDANKNGAEIVVKHGQASSNPQPPAISQTEALYELHLLHARRNAGAAAITAADVTDLRLNNRYCGLMADSVTKVDTSAINAQVNALIEELRGKLESVENQTYYASKEYVDTKRRTATLLASSWSGSGPYTQNVSVSGLSDTVFARAYVDVPDNAATEAALAEETPKVTSCKRSGNIMTFRCREEKPSVNIPIVVEVYV